jgi:hypothetical protein
MNDEQLKALLDEMQAKKKQADDVAQMKAMEYVNSNDPAHRAASQQWQGTAVMWGEAMAMVRKHRAN